MRGIVPDEEQNDAAVIAEAALIGAQILLSSDSHLIETQEHLALRETLRDFHVERSIIIARPATIARKFSR